MFCKCLFSRYYGTYEGFRPVLVLKDPELIKQLGVKDFDHFKNHKDLVPEGSDHMWERNLFALKDEKWRHMRQTLSPSFSKSKLKTVFSLITDYVKNYVRYYEEQTGPICLDMKDALSRFTNDVIATTAFGINCDSIRNRNNEFYQKGKAISNIYGITFVAKLFALRLFPKLSKTLGIHFFSKNVCDFFTNLIRENLQNRRKNNIVRRDFIQILMESLKNENVADNKPNGLMNGEVTMTPNENVVDDYITSQAMLFFFAGFDTVSNTINFMAYELAINVDVQERLQKEVDETFSENNDNITYEALTKMKYMDMVITESLRKWTPPVNIIRVCNKPYTVEAVGDEPSVHLKKGAIVWIPIHASHRNPEIYPNPDRFDPERFSDENKSTMHPYSFFSFGVGPRMCIGNRFALMEIKLLFSYMLRTFNIVVNDKTVTPIKICPKSHRVIAKYPIWLNLERRRL
ncbi:hypothetical protein FQA39_LY16102 [Lamprigera yunnana]|nr:hypothetical protein FQA39_LY16102 [Lamprigera yunnana]